MGPLPERASPLVLAVLSIAAVQLCENNQVAALTALAEAWDSRFRDRQTIFRRDVWPNKRRT